VLSRDGPAVYRDKRRPIPDYAKPSYPVSFPLNTAALFRRYRFTIGPRGAWGWREHIDLAGRWEPYDMASISRSWINFVETLIVHQAPGAPKRQRRRAAKLALAAIEEEIKALATEEPAKPRTVVVGPPRVSASSPA
jgi:hypothetical protein